MQPLQQILPDSRRSTLAHVRALGFVAVQVSHLLARLLQAHQPEESPILAHR